MYNIVQVYRYRVAGYSLHYDGRSVSLEAVNIRSSISDELLVMGSRNICIGDTGTPTCGSVETVIAVYLHR